MAQQGYDVRRNTYQASSHPRSLRRKKSRAGSWPCCGLARNFGGGIALGDVYKLVCDTCSMAERSCDFFGAPDTRTSLFKYISSIHFSNFYFFIRQPLVHVYSSNISLLWRRGNLAHTPLLRYGIMDCFPFCFSDVFPCTLIKGHVGWKYICPVTGSVTSGRTQREVLLRTQKNKKNNRDLTTCTIRRVKVWGKIGLPRQSRFVAFEIHSSSHFSIVHAVQGDMIATLDRR